MPVGSVRVRLRDVRECSRLVGECREAGSDPCAWQVRLLEGLRTLVDAQVGIAGNMRGLHTGRRPEGVGIALRVGWPDDDTERRWRRYAESVPIERTREYASLTALRGSGLTLRREAIWRTDDWHASATFNDHHRACGLDDYILSLHAAPGAGLHHSLWLHRAVGRPAFGRREWWIVRFVHGEIAAAIGSALAPAGSPSPRDLSPRQRQVLRRLLEGDAEKQIAAALGLKAATVHEHVGQIYRRFRVRSRAELLARFVTRPTDPSV